MSEDSRETKWQSVKWIQNTKWKFWRTKADRDKINRSSIILEWTEQIHYTNRWQLHPIDAFDLIVSLGQRHARAQVLALGASKPRIAPSIEPINYPSGTTDRIRFAIFAIRLAFIISRWKEEKRKRKRKRRNSRRSGHWTEDFFSARWTRDCWCKKESFLSIDRVKKKSLCLLYSRTLLQSSMIASVKRAKRRITNYTRRSNYKHSRITLSHLCLLHPPVGLVKFNDRPISNSLVVGFVPTIRLDFACLLHLPLPSFLVFFLPSFPPHSPPLTPWPGYIGPNYRFARRSSAYVGWSVRRNKRTQRWTFVLRRILLALVLRHH